MLKANISSWFISQDIVSSFSISDPKKMPAADSSDVLAYREDLVDLMLAHYSVEQPAETVDGHIVMKTPKKHWYPLKSE